MPERSGLTIAVLAAGQSRRFGEADKLAAPFRGKTLGRHAADTLAAMPACRKWIIAPQQGHACADDWRSAGFEIAINPAASQGMGTSAALAASLALEEGADALLIALADMPLVPLRHFEDIAKTAQNLGQNGIAASSDGTAAMPPACFRHGRFKQLAEARGDTGARSHLAEAHIVHCPPQWLADIDEPGDISRIE